MNLIIHRLGGLKCGSELVCPFPKSSCVDQCRGQQQGECLAPAQGTGHRNNMPYHLHRRVTNKSKFQAETAGYDWFT